MKFKKIWRQDSILKYLKAKDTPPNTKHVVVKVDYFLRLWKYKTVIFYEQKDIIKLLRDALVDVVQNELNIVIKSSSFNFPNWQQESKVIINLETENDNLLVGKFNQNQQSLETFFTFFLSNFFKIKYEVQLVFVSFAKRRERKFFKPGHFSKN